MSQRTTANMVALLRANGYSREQIADGFGRRRDWVDAQASKGDHLSDGWTPDRLANECMRFHKTVGRWPIREDFKGVHHRRQGLPAWSQITRVMWGPAWNWMAWERMYRRLKELDLLTYFEVRMDSSRGFPENGWVLLQAYMARHRDLTSNQILDLPNVLVRRRAIEAIGWERFLRSPGIKALKKDRFGALYRIPGEMRAGGQRGENMVMLEVTNSTKEKDGSFAKYVLRVPPNMTCPRQAVAWTFGVTTGWRNFDFAAET